ncbi:MAG: hypothetical protein AAF965_01970 [Pseudomonadota bacterium]
MTRAAVSLHADQKGAALSGRNPDAMIGFRIANIWQSNSLAVRKKSLFVSGPLCLPASFATGAKSTFVILTTKRGRKRLFRNHADPKEPI